MYSFPHDSIKHDRLYSASDFRNFFLPFYKNGIFTDPANSCMAMASGENRTVTIKPGRCYINGCVGYTDGTETIDIPIPDDYKPRYDLIVLRLDLMQRDIHIDVISGTPSETPVYPELTRSSLKYDIAIAAIKSVPTAYEILQSDITDLRFNNQYCGIVTGAIDTIDTADLFAQYDARWDMLMAGFSGDEAAIIAAFNALLTVKSVNGIAPADSGGNVLLTLDDIPDGTSKKLDKTVQCGTVTTSRNTETEVVFDTPYTEAPVITATAEYNSGSDVTTTYSDVYIGEVTNTGFKVRTYYTSGSTSSAKVHWIAIGV